MNKKQTAVDYLVEELIKFQIIEKDGPFTAPIIEKAKELEKQQIINAWIVENNALQIMSAEQYYKDNYEATDK